jgi:myo-inositol-1(or 4)-monophosphatase
MPRSELPPDLASLVSAVLATVEDVSLTTGPAPEEQTKGDGSLVTKMDMALQSSLTRNLQDGWPGIPVLGEESRPEEARAILEGLGALPGRSADSGFTDRSVDSGFTDRTSGSGFTGQPAGSASTGASFWCIDPLDGTSNFVAGFPLYAASVALIDEGGPRLGVVHDLARDETFAAVRGGGAWLGRRRLASGEGAPDDLAEAMALVDLKRLPPKLAARVATEHPFRSQRNIGSSALEWCWVAAGRCHLYLHGSQKPWDYAAGMLILAEAGGSFALEPEPSGSIGFDLKARSVTAASSEALLAAWQAWILKPDDHGS